MPNRSKNTIYKWLKILFAFSVLGIIEQNNIEARAIMPKQYGTEGRFKTWTYYPNTVFYFVGYYMNPTYIEFEEKESVTTISTPKPTAWQFVPNGNRLFLKPIEDNASTTATVMTNRRTYFFELHAREASGPFDPNVSFFIKFRYPSVSKDGEEGEEHVIYEYSTSAIPNLSRPELLNFQYTISGDEIISPIAVFDDGRFTYMKFKETVPAIFSVDDDGFEAVVNFRAVGDYIVVERVGSIYTLRNGVATVCVFNEAMLEQDAVLKK